MTGELDELLTGVISCLFFVTFGLAIFQISIYYLQSRFNSPHQLPILACPHEKELKRAIWQKVFNHIHWVDAYYIIFILYQIISAVYFVLSVFLEEKVKSNTIAGTGIAVSVLESLPYPCCYIAITCMYSTTFQNGVFKVLVSSFSMTLIMFAVAIILIGSTFSLNPDKRVFQPPFSIFNDVPSDQYIVIIFQEWALILNIVFVGMCIILLIVIWGISFRLKVPDRKGMLRLFFCLFFQGLSVVLRMCGPKIANVAPSFSSEYTHFIGQCIWSICAGQIFVEQKLCYSEFAYSMSILKKGKEKKITVTPQSRSDLNYASMI